MPWRESSAWSRTVQVLRVVLYVAVLLGGIAGIIWTPGSLGLLPTVVSDIAGGLAALGALPALVGAITRLYGIELAGMPLVLGGMGLLCIVVLDDAQESLPLTMYAGVSLALLCALTIRTVDLLALSRRMRTGHHDRG